jgi:hypothetical protein
MKKLFLVLSAFALVLGSCSKSEDEPVVVQPDPVEVVPPVVVPSGILLTKTITTGTTGTVTTKNFTYNGNKLVSASSTSGFSSETTYSGDLITKIEDFTNAVLSKRETFAYDANGRLSSYTFRRFNSGNDNVTKSVLTYLPNGDITSINYIGDDTAQTTQVSTSKAFFTNGEITKKETYTPATPNNIAVTSTFDYTYDLKNNPFKNITGFTKIAYSYETKGFARNIATWASSNTSGTLTDFIYTNTRTYNSSDYPVTESSVRTGNSGSSSTVTTQFFY